MKGSLDFEHGRLALMQMHRFTALVRKTLQKVSHCVSGFIWCHQIRRKKLASHGTKSEASREQSDPGESACQSGAFAVEILRHATGKGVKTGDCRNKQPSLHGLTCRPVQARQSMKRGGDSYLVPYPGLRRTCPGLFSCAPLGLWAAAMRCQRIGGGKANHEERRKMIKGPLPLGGKTEQHKHRPTRERRTCPGLLSVAPMGPGSVRWR